VRIQFLVVVVLAVLVLVLVVMLLLVVALLLLLLKCFLVPFSQLIAEVIHTGTACTPARGGAAGKAMWSRRCATFYLFT